MPRGYVPDMRTKIDLYRRLARLTTEAAVDDFASELADRFGPLPDGGRASAGASTAADLGHRLGRAARFAWRIAMRCCGYTSREKLRGW